jgi:hypothetical protein
MPPPVSALLQKICVKNKESGGYYKIRTVKVASKALIPNKTWGLKRVPPCGVLVITRSISLPGVLKPSYITYNRILNTSS